MKIRRGRTGLAFISIYGAMAIPLLAYAYNIVGDPKGAYVFKQAAVAPALLMMDLIFTGRYESIPQTLNKFPVSLLLSFMIVYSVGWLAGTAGKFVFSKFHAWRTTERVRRPISALMRTSRYLLATAFFFWLA